MKVLHITSVVIPIVLAITPPAIGQVGAAPETKVEAGATVVLFVAMGQSNMVGARVPEKEVPGPEYDQRILSRISAGTAQDKKSPEALLQDGSAGDAGFSPGVRGGGPDRSFVRSIAAEGFPVALVKWARNGSSIELWSRDIPPGHDGSYYDAWMAYVKESIAQLEGMGLKVVIGGLFWSQGAADSNKDAGESRSPHYEDRLRALVDRFRSEVPGAEDAPVIIVRTCGKIDDERYPFKEVVRAAQVKVADGGQSIGWIDIDDMPLRDAVHHTPEGYQAIGIRAARAWLERFSDSFAEIREESTSR